MNHLTSPEFWPEFDKLPENVQSSARKNFELLKSNPRHPSLQFKKTGRLWSVRANLSFRALAVEDGNDYVWFWIGTHDRYLQIIGAA